MVIHMSRSVENTLYCSAIMTFCVGPGDQHGREAAEQSPPLWSLVMYMLLTERLNIGDDTLRQKFNLPVPLGDPGPSSSSLGSRYGAQGPRRSGRLETIREAEGSRYSGRLAEVRYHSCSFTHGADELLQAPRSMNVRCFDGILMRFTLVGISQYRDEHSDKCPLIHLDRHLGAAWSSVYASSKSDIVIKFGVIPQEDRAKERQLRNEAAAYNKLGRIAGWIVPHLYGEYQWHGGRALVMSDGGTSLKDFTSLYLLQRCVLRHFDEICANISIM